VKDFEGLAELAVPIFWLGLALVFRRLRRDTVGKAERDQFRTRLSPWVTGLEMLNVVVIFAGLSLVAFSVLLRLHATFHGSSPATGLAIMLIGVACAIGLLPPAMILANLVSWVIPPLRAANELANAGLPTTSFAGANNGLLVASAIVLPLCILQAALGVIEPWVR
jgi:hypothetical protein